jgi:ABC-2 type transport system ATP-binding protein
LQAVIRIDGLSKRYGAIHALDRVSFEVRQGEVLGLIGPNGSGKTTLFECIGGVMPFDGGRIESAQPLFYLPDAIAPWPEQPVRWAFDFVSGYFAAPSGLRDAIVAAFALDSLLDQRIGHLSKGQRKRVLLGLGLLTSRPVVLADEPFDGLDLRQTREVAAALRSFARDGRTLVLSIHQIADAARVCDRFVLLSGGTIRGQGTLDELIDQATARLRTSGTSGTLNTLEDAFLALT